VKRLAWTIFLALPALAIGQDSPKDLDKLLKLVESRYNRAQSIQLDFSETYAGRRRPVQDESGVLYLRKPGRMRWEYAKPPGKVFLSDGKNVFLYTPDEHRAEKSTLKQSDDERTPIAFLLGKLDFSREFKDFRTRSENGGTWIVAAPKSENLAYTGVEFLATPEGQIQRVRITGQDQSRLDFTFRNERQNVALAASLFTFNPPPGVEIIEAGQ
jgi:outer membrane lipoprotein carrier protein